MHAISLGFAFGGIRSDVSERKNLAGRGNALKRHQRNVAPLPDDFISAACCTRIGAETAMEAGGGSAEQDVTAAAQ